MDTSEYYIESVKKQFLYYKTIAEKAITQLEPEQLFYTHNEDTNSIAVIIKHLHGNMLSRWTDFFTSDGEKEWRNRDDEFVDDWKSKETVMQKWEEGWACLFTALDNITAQNLGSIISIRNEGHAVIEAVNRQLAHYAYHVGQIIFYAKLLKKESWNSLSIPKNKSKDYNREKFASDKTERNFIDDALDKLNKVE